MTRAQELATAAEIAEYLEAQSRKPQLRFLTCGSVDDGKSTLIGRLLYESKLVFEDQLAALEADSARLGGQGAPLDFSLLVDGLAAEREQRITIDVAYRFFATDKRKFIVADTPGHVQYTRNMATGASTAELAVVMVDARKGVLTQTRRHSHIVSLLGVRHVALCVNKMDLVGFDRAVFDAIAQDYRGFAATLGLEHVVAIPVSALEGDNVVARSARIPWFDGPSLLEHLETVEITPPAEDGFRMPVQWVSRPDQGFRGFAGQVVSGVARPGDRLKALPSGRESRVARIVTMDGDLPQAVSGHSVTLTLEDEIDVSRGDVLATAEDPPEVADQFQAKILWMAESEMLPGRSYLLKMGVRTVGAQITEEKYTINVDSGEHLAGKTLALNEIGVCNISLDRAIPFAPYARNRAMGGFILIDRITNATVGAGMIDFALRRAANIHHQALDVNKAARAAAMGQTPRVLWFTGLSGAGKSTIANLAEKKLFALGKRTYTLDGDNVRHGLNRDLGFTDADRVENIRRVAEVAKLMADAGLIVLVSFISPFRSERRMARDMLELGEFWEIHVDTPLAEAEKRDVKGLYAKARAGQIKNFTGIDSPYEPPESPEMRVDTLSMSAEAAAEQIVERLLAAG